MLQLIKYADLDTDIKNTLEFYIEQEFGHIPLVQETHWASPDWSLFWLNGDKLVSFCNIVIREVHINNEVIKVGGLNNMITPAKHRGNKYSTNLLQAFERVIFEDLDLNAGLLLCADNLVPFYQKLNWRKLDCPVFFEQPDGKKQWEANTMMLFDNSAYQPSSIDLNGLPW
jgi:hypothetical protein